MMGFHTSKFSQEDDEDTSFCLRTENVIPIAVYDNHFTWAKYGEIILQSTGSLAGFEKHQLHSTFCRAFHELLRIDGKGRLSPAQSVRKIKNVLSIFLMKKKIQSIRMINRKRQRVKISQPPKRRRQRIRKINRKSPKIHQLPERRCLLLCLRMKRRGIFSTRE